MLRKLYDIKNLLKWISGFEYFTIGICFQSMVLLSWSMFVTIGDAAYATSQFTFFFKMIWSGFCFFLVLVNGMNINTVINSSTNSYKAHNKILTRLSK